MKMALNLSKNKINKLISLLNSSDDESDLDNVDENVEKDNAEECEVIKVVNLEHIPIEIEDSSGSESEDDKPIIPEDCASSDEKNSITEITESDPNDPLNINLDDKNLNINLLYPIQESESTDFSSTVRKKGTKTKNGKRKYIKNSMLKLDYRDDEALHELTKSSPARGKFQCHLCKSRCFTQTQLNSHLKIHESSDAGKFYCRTCDILFATSPNLRRHIKSHQLKPKRFAQNDQILTEIQYETTCMPNESKILECKICNLTFPKILNLRQHLQNHLKPGTIDIENLKQNNYLTNLIPNGQTNLGKLIEYIVAELEAGRTERFYSATNMAGNEMSLSDSETDTDAEDEIMLENIYGCELCEKKFPRRYKILNHQRKDHTEDEMENECDVCKIKYVSKNLLKYHVKTQCGSTAKHYSCYICKMKYMWKDNMIKHIKLHHKSKREECKICKKQVTRLDSHLVVHELEKNFQCDKCLMKFKRKSNLRVHMKIHAENYNDGSEVHKSHLCGFCGRKFRSSSNLAVHIRRHTGEKPYKCEFCDRGYPSSSDLKTHLKSHTREKPVKVNDPPEVKKHICGICGREFRKSSNLVVHTRRHTGEKPYKCEFCDRGYPSSSDLNRHRRTHTGEKPIKVNVPPEMKKSYLCGLCGKKFRSSSNLSAHVRRHTTGEKSNKCEFCDKVFPNSAELNIHLKTHAGEKPVKVNDSKEVKQSHMLGLGFVFLPGFGFTSKMNQ